MIVRPLLVVEVALVFGGTGEGDEGPMGVEDPIGGAGEMSSETGDEL